MSVVRDHLSALSLELRGAADVAMAEVVEVGTVVPETAVATATACAVIAAVYESVSD